MNRTLTKRTGIAAAIALAFFWLAQLCFGQGTLQFGFEGAAYLGAVHPTPPGTFSSTSYYYDYASGMGFWNSYGLVQLQICGGGISSRPEDGSAYLQVPTGAKLEFTFESGRHFNLVSFDAATYDTALPGPVTLQVVGYGAMYLRVTNSFTVSSLADRRASQLPDFQTFTFDARFTDLYRIDVLTDGWSLDNVVISGVPEPSAGALLVLGALSALGWSRMRKQRTWQGR